MTDRLWYLASPYTKYPYGQDQAARDVAKVAAELTKMDFTVYSPIIHSHYIANYMDNHLDAKYWIKHQRTILDKCDGIIVAMLEDWHLSEGINHEVDLFRKDGRPVLHARYDEHPLYINGLATYVEEADPSTGHVIWRSEVKLFDYSPPA